MSDRLYRCEVEVRLPDGMDDSPMTVLASVVSTALSEASIACTRIVVEEAPDYGA